MLILSACLILVKVSVFDKFGRIRQNMNLQAQDCI